ncbi:MAG: hypothetical protein F6K31_42670, partial [Symploca sp. SIO2G7]|nr:hypothetical protein [Symploca sp. SIO2G7]
KVIKLKGGQVLSGLSGSTLLNQRTGKVCGVINRTRNKGSDLGGEAIPTDIIFSEISILKEIHDEFHQVNRKWIELLEFDSEPYASDWSYLDLKRSRLSSYFKALVFLVCTSIKWFFMGFYAPRAFPTETIQKIFEHTFKGNLGEEINKQRKELVFRLNSEVDFEKTGQARIINQLLSQSNVLFTLIEILVDDEQTLASVSRLSWAAELICEQKDLLNELKKKEGNYYPRLENLKKSLPFLESNLDRDMYLKSDRILGKLVAQHTDTYFLLFHSLNNVLVYLVELLKKNPNLGLFFLEILLLYFGRMNFEESYMSQQDKDEVYIKKTNAILQELESMIAKNPKLKILRKTKILLEAVVGEPITGGKYRAWGKTTAFHFSRRCKLYPERARPYEMEKIQCYDSFEEAKQNHNACKTCMNAERKAGSDEYFLGEDYPAE